MSRPDAEAGDGAGTGRGIGAAGGDRADGDRAGARRRGLGPDFGKLWAAASISTLGDGLTRPVAAPGAHAGQLLGRVVSAFRLIGYGTIPLGALLGGVLARAIDLRAPYLIGSAALLVIALLAIPVLNTRTINAARAATPT